jgi:protease-4
VMDDDGIAGILLRLDTPGGLGLASDRIGKMVAEAAAAKPLVISSVDVNASGGYMVSYRCNTIVALPSSIVGSIGAFSLRPTAARLLDKLGVSVDRVTIGPHATVLSPVVPLTDDEFTRLTEVQWHSYDRWVEGIAQHRRLTLDQVDRLARGRVFTGRQALANGLIDAVGGFDEALALLKSQLDIPAKDDVTLLHYPVRKSLLEELRAGDWADAAQGAALRLGLRSEEEARIATTVTVLRQWLQANEPLLLYDWRFR